MFILDAKIDPDDITVFSGLVRSFFAMIDNAIYNMISVVYNLIEDLSYVSILSLADLNDFAKRIYALLGIFMLFKISFSIISYIVSPDKLTDSTNGMGGIIKNVIITLALILTVPTAFNILYDAQAAILKENVIPKFLLGEEKSENEMVSNKEEGINETFSISPQCSYNQQKNSSLLLPTVKDRGTYISLLTFRNFYQIVPVEGANGEANIDEKFMVAYCGFNSKNIDVSYFLQSGIYNGPVEDLPEDETWYNSNFSKVTLTILTLGSYPLVKTIANWVVSALGFGPTTYYVNYNLFISTVCGIVVLLFLVSMAFEVALRSIKLTFLQLISPIPIISYIDPKSGKDGTFKRWYMEVFKTWASLFIRLAALFFGIYLIQRLDKLYTIDPEHNFLSSNFWIQFFLLLGILMFCKQLPQLIEQLIPGMKMGSFKLNPIKNISENALGGKFLVGAAGAVGAGAIGIAGSTASHMWARNKLKGSIKNKELEKQQLNDKIGFNNARLLNNENKIRYLKDLKKDVKSGRASGRIDDEKAKQLYSSLDRRIKEKVSENADIKAKNVELKEDIGSKQKDLDKMKDTRLYKNPVTGYMGSVSRGAMVGMKEGYKSPSKFIQSGIKATEKASAMRNYRDKYSVGDQFMDKLTDIAGVKNSSGTTSIVSQSLKKANDALNQVNRNIDMMNRSLSNLQSKMGSEFNIAVQFDDNNRMKVANNYNGQYLNELNSMISQYNNQIDQKISLEKEIKDLEDTKNFNRPNGK